jgi:type I restriction enzyme S subunit
MKWPIVPLSIAVNINPRNREWTSLPDETEVTFVSMSAVSEKTASIVFPEIRTLGKVRRGYTPFQENDILFAKITPCMENGKAALAKNLVNNLGFGSTEFHVLRPNKSVLPEYIYYFIRQQNFRNLAKQNMCGGVGQQRVPEDFIKTYYLPLPALSEQRRIVEILDQADALRRMRAEADAKAERILPALFIKMFGDPATNPMGWDVILVEKLFSKERSGTKCGPFRSALKKHEYVNNGVPVWGIDNIKPNQFLESGSLFITPTKYEELKSYSVEPGDVIISRAGTVGRMCVAQPQQSPSIISTNLIRLTLDKKHISPEYFTSLLSYFPASVNQLRASGDDGAYSFMNTTILKSLKIPLPPFELQNEYTLRMSEIRRLNAKQIESQARLNHLFQSFLYQAFSGELTAKWREAHMKELLAEMEEQVKVLNLVDKQDKQQLSFL